MASRETSASARLVTTDCRSTVEVQVPVGMRFEDILLERPKLLVEVIQQFRPRGCEACLSGRDLVIRERFDDIVNVELGG